MEALIEQERRESLINKYVALKNHSFLIFDNFEELGKIRVAILNSFDKSIEELKKDRIYRKAVELINEINQTVEIGALSSDEEHRLINKILH